MPWHANLGFCLSMHYGSPQYQPLMTIQSQVLHGLHAARLFPLSIK